MRNLSTASLAASVHSCCFGGAYLWALVLSALYLCSGSTSFVLRSDGVIGDCTNAPAILAPCRSASLQRNVSHAAPSARHPPFHTSTILSSHAFLPALSVASLFLRLQWGRRRGMPQKHRSRHLRAALWNVLLERRESWQCRCIPLWRSPW